MTRRDRLVLIGIAAFAVLGVVWLLLVSPERKQAGQLQAKVDAAGAQLASAERQVADARRAQARYASAYASVVSLGKAVPPGREVPALVYELAQASNRKHVDFTSISSTSAAASGAAASPSSTAAAPAAAAAAAGFSQMPFTFVFNGTFADLYHLFQQLNRFTVHSVSGGLQVSGRLLTLQGVKLVPAASTGPTQKVAKRGHEQLTGTITATAYVLPTSQGLAGGATAASPGAVQSASLAGASGTSSPTAPAIARVNP